jgi:hypothetical protein
VANQRAPRRWFRIVPSVEGDVDRMSLYIHHNVCTK